MAFDLQPVEGLGGAILIGLLAWKSVAGTATFPPPPSPSRCAAEPFAGARLDCAVTARTGRPPPVALPKIALRSFVEIHSSEVRHAMLLFQPAPGDRFAQARARDQLRLWHAPSAMGSSFAGSIGAFGGAILAAAHAPAPLRFVFDAPLHLGPAVFRNSGGMGIGIGFSF